MKTTATTTTCRAEWGLLPEAGEYGGSGLLTNVRTGRHTFFDRVVFVFDGRPSWSLVHYVKNVVTMGQGHLVPLRGDAKLEVILAVPSYDDTGHSTYNPANRDELTNVRHYRTFRQLADAGSFEGRSAHYTTNVYRAGAGHLVPLRGGAKLEIMLGVREMDANGHWAFNPSEPLTSVEGYRTFRQVSYAGSTEGAAWVGLGVRARLPFRVFTLAGPGSGSRIVIDVAHTW